MLQGFLVVTFVGLESSLGNHMLPDVGFKRPVVGMKGIYLVSEVLVIEPGIFIQDLVKAYAHRRFLINRMNVFKQPFGQPLKMVQLVNLSLPGLGVG